MTWEAYHHSHMSTVQFPLFSSSCTYMLVLFFFLSFLASPLHVGAEAICQANVLWNHTRRCVKI